MNGNRNKPASRQYEQYRAAIQRIEARLQPQLEAWEAEKLRCAMVRVFGEEAMDDDRRKPPAEAQTAVNPAGSANIQI